MTMSFNKELDRLLDAMMDIEAPVADSLDKAIQAIGLLVVRIEDLQGFVIHSGLNITEFNEYMEGRDNVTIH
jgi:hypothetical protein